MALSLYFLPLRAQAEPIRMILHFAEIPFNDVIISMQDWNNVKNSTNIAPFGQLPSLQLPSGEIIAQSGAIVRYVAKLANIYPEDLVLAARADMIYEFAQDLSLINPLFNFWPVMTEDWTTNYKAYFDELPRFLVIASGFLGQHAPYFGGNIPHHGDFALFHILDLSVTINSTCLNEFPLIQNYHCRMSQLPQLQNYLQNRAPPANVGLCGSYVQTHIANVFHHH
jgi:glutathione S-transferase